MSSTAKIRLYLLLIAILPPLLMILVIYFFSINQYEQLGGENAYRNLQKFSQLQDSYLENLKDRAVALSKSPELEQAALLIKSGRADQVNLGRLNSSFDIIEIVDSTFKVLASDHRPGLIGEIIHPELRQHISDKPVFLETIEYDLNGSFASLGYFVPINRNLLLYAAKYINDEFILLTEQLLNARVELYLNNEDTIQNLWDFAQLNRGQLFQDKSRDTLVTLLAGSQKAGYVLLAKIDISGKKPVFVSLLRSVALVALISVILAILLGIYVTGQTKKEIDNLIEATKRIADGDLKTPVMAYQEGEFSELADSFTEMKLRLRKSLDELSASEKIAAWKEMGQKIAHEVKNPLTPIAISIDDLRQSYYEKLPEFDKIIDETTSVIKAEVNRLIKLLDQFVKFARMEPPIVVESSISNIIDGIVKLYQREIEAKKLMIDNKCRRDKIRCDPEKIKQLLINLIKNGLESSPNASVSVNSSDFLNELKINIEDTGPGFPEMILNSHIRPSTSTKKGGSGLGLVISSRIVHDHGGNIIIYNREKGGGGVEIDLPFENV